MNKPYCSDKNCSRSSVCNRFKPLAPHDELGNFKEWRSSECHFFFPINDDITPQERRELAREVVNDERKDLK